ncbi:hypothetical protein ACWGQ4_00680 [Streptomyces sp. NPDC055721]|uniref:hypothetical protein n=1 Tax=Streptomyces sp. NPDC127132 TaxID=3345374 RepID=UPI00363E37DE
MDVEIRRPIDLLPDREEDGAKQVSEGSVARSVLLFVSVGLATSNPTTNVYAFSIDIGT